LQGVRPNLATAVSQPESLGLTLGLWLDTPNSTPMNASCKDFVLRTAVSSNSQPSIQHYVVFQILDTEGKNLGYYMRDPFIEVHN
jgi:hypothetical protein